MPLESILHFEEQGYPSDVWPVGVIFLQFVTRKYSVFRDLRLENKPAHLKSTYYVNYIMQLAVLFGDRVVEQCSEFGYDLVLPAELDKKVEFSFKAVAKLEGFDEVAESLLKRLLELNPKRRIKVEDALAHPFFK